MSSPHASAAGGEFTIDKATVRAFLAKLHDAAARAFAGAAVDPGFLQLVRIPPAGGSAIATRFRIGQVDDMADDAIRAAEGRLNVYVEGRTVQARSTGRGKIGDTVGVWAFVDDSDADKGREGIPVIEASFIVETSPGNRHNWLVLDRALTVDEAKPIGDAIRAAIKSDHDTGTITQPYRVAGTPNFPSPAKIARGRITIPTKLLGSTGRVWSKDELLAAFPLVTGASSPVAPGGRSGRTSATVEAIVAEPGTDRSVQFYRAVAKAIEAGMLPADLEDVMRRHPDGCASKYLSPRDRLHEELIGLGQRLPRSRRGPGLIRPTPIAPCPSMKPGRLSRTPSRLTLMPAPVSGPSGSRRGSARRASRLR